MTSVLAAALTPWWLFTAVTARVWAWLLYGPVG